MSSSAESGRDAALGFFAADVDLDQHVEHLVEFLRGVIQPLRQLGGIDGIDRMKNLRRLRGFVRLQMADHVESRVLQFCDSREIFGELLHAILAKEALSRGVGFKNRCGGKGLCIPPSVRRHQDFVPRAGPQLSDALTDGAELFGDAHGNPSLKQRRGGYPCLAD